MMIAREAPALCTIRALLLLKPTPLPHTHTPPHSHILIKCVLCKYLYRLNRAHSTFKTKKLLEHLLVLTHTHTYTRVNTHVTFAGAGEDSGVKVIVI